MTGPAAETGDLLPAGRPRRLSSSLGGAGNNSQRQSYASLTRISACWHGLGGAMGAVEAARFILIALFFGAAIWCGFWLLFGAVVVEILRLFSGVIL